MLGAASLAAVAPASVVLASSEDVTTPLNPRAYFQRYPTLFAPFYGDDERATLLKTVVPDRVWCLEQNLAVGPLETPLRCVVIRLKDDSLWVHAPLAPTAEFFQLIEGLGTVKHVVVPTYALEHKIFTKDACDRWPEADLWIAPGQFAFPVEVSPERIYGRKPTGVLGDAAVGGGAGKTPPWLEEIDVKILKSGSFALGGRDVGLREATFFHVPTKTMVVTDSIALIPNEIPPLIDPSKLLLVGKKSTADITPEVGKFILVFVRAISMTMTCFVYRLAGRYPRCSRRGVEEDDAAHQLLLPGARGTGRWARGGDVDGRVGGQLRRNLREAVRAAGCEEFVVRSGSGIRAGVGGFRRGGLVRPRGDDGDGRGRSVDHGANAHSCHGDSRALGRARGEREG